MGWKPLAVLSLAATTALSCSHIFQDANEGTSNPNSPSAATPSPSAIPIVVVPIPVPTAVAPPPSNPSTPSAPTNPGTPGTPTTPTTPATPAPTPPPNNPPSSGSCSLPPGTGAGNDCPKLSASFQGEVNSAITRLAQQRPDIFGQQAGPNFLVVKHDDYMNGVVANLRARGLCAIVDSDDEIAVKNANSFNDQYDILASSGYTRADGSYTATCSPAWF